LSLPSEQKRTIAFLFHEASRTGAPMVLARLLNWLAFREHTWLLHVIVPADGPLLQELHSSIVVHKLSEAKVSNITPNIVKRGIRRITGHASEVNQDPIITVLRKLKPDIIYLNTTAWARKFSEVRLAVPSGLIIWHIHELKLALGAMKIQTPDFHRADMLIANSDSTREYLLTEYKVPAHMVKTVYPPLPDIQSLPLPAATDNGQFVVGTVGTALPRKGAEIFLHIAYRYLQKYPDSNVLFRWVGSTASMFGELEHDVTKAGLSNVELRNNIQNIWLEMSDFSLFISTSKEESFGLAAAEALSLNVPLMAFSDCNEISNLARRSGGFVIKYFDIEAAVNQIYELSKYSVTALREQFLRQDAILEYSLEVVAPNWLNTIQDFSNRFMRN
jgi:glycosyltransferase involved in cell wall biosynthesis